MKQIIISFPQQFAKGAECARGIKLDGSFNNIVICGVGGSALPGNLLLDLADISIPVFIHRDYNLPKIASAKSLIVCISFSGNTEETLSAYEEAIAKKYPVIALCTGGKLEELAKNSGNPVAVVPNDCLQPRFGTGYLVSALIKILDNCKITNNLSQEILKIAERLKPENFEAQGKILGEKLACPVRNGASIGVNKIPVVYTSNQYKSVAKIWKIKFNENSKTMAFWNFFPELNHNEMVGLTGIKNQESGIRNFYFIILKDGDDNPKILKRMEITESLIKESRTDVEIIEMQGITKMEKIFNTLLLGDWASYYLALAYGQNPVPVEIVEKFKKQL
ncbi:MAG: bifunctional phosphoglucose/phosphomannose isomerase [Candidatus Pacebacteria bacterium]|nr:bifunctional phosphoglucose/phosphomannose isomerase [Candidatus Paceibacterota bacterium]